MDPTTFADSFATIVSLLAEFVARREANKNKSFDEFLEWLSEQRHEEIRILLEQNVRTTIGIKALLGEISKQTEEIRNLSQQNLALSRAILGNTQQLTGHGSFPFAFIGGGQDNGNKTQILIGLHGEFALPNLTARIVSIPDYSNVSGLDLRTLGMNVPEENIGTLRQHEFKYFLVETRTQETAVTIFFRTDNHSWRVHIRIRKTSSGREWLAYVQDQDGSYLWKNVSPDFPNQSGEFVLWSNTTKRIDV